MWGLPAAPQGAGPRACALSPAAHAALLFQSSLCPPALPGAASPGTPPSKETSSHARTGAVCPGKHPRLLRADAGSRGDLHGQGHAHFPCFNILFCYYNYIEIYSSATCTVLKHIFHNDRNKLKVKASKQRSRSNHRYCNLVNIFTSLAHHFLILF